jgi:hypothetical protein
MNLEEETKRITLEYIKTGCIGYHKLLKYINGNMKGDLDLSNTKVSHLPKYLKVGGWLDLCNTPITTLPKDLKVGDNLYLHKTSITSLPEGLTVGGFLNLSNTPISKKHTIQELKQMLPNLKGRILI